MDPYHFHPLKKHRAQEWHKEITKYLIRRYSPIVNRINNTIRYVEIDPVNYLTFSYEYASLLRDIGGSFSSIMDSFLKGLNIKPKYGGLYNVLDYRDFLFNKIEDFDRVGVILSNTVKENMIFPFEDFVEKKKITAEWWKAYNDVKHTEIYSLQKGCLSNVLYGFSALTILFDSLILSKLFKPQILSESTGNIISHISMFQRNVIYQVFPKMGAQSALDCVRAQAREKTTSARDKDFL